jgi:hypothetical protein
VWPGAANAWVAYQATGELITATRWAFGATDEHVPVAILRVETEDPPATIDIALDVEDELDALRRALTCGKVALTDQATFAGLPEDGAPRVGTGRGIVLVGVPTEPLAEWLLSVDPTAAG